MQDKNDKQKEYIEINLPEKLRAFFETKEKHKIPLYITKIATVIELQTKEIDPEIGEDVADSLRDWILDLSDEITSFGGAIPFVCAIKSEKESDEFNLWHKKAGDQDWHRGDFAIIIQSREEKKDKLVNLITGNVNFLPYPIEKISPDEYAEKIDKKLDESNRSLSDPQKILLEITRDELKQKEIPQEEIILKRWKESIEAILEQAKDDSEKGI